MLGGILNGIGRGSIVMTLSIKSCCPHKLVYTTMHASTTQMHNLFFKPNVLKEVAYTLVPPFTKISSNPSCCKFTPIHDLGVEANQRLMGVNTSVECCM
jgi:hypothetical protein